MVVVETECSKRAENHQTLIKKTPTGYTSPDTKHKNYLKKII